MKKDFILNDTDNLIIPFIWERDETKIVNPDEFEGFKYWVENNVVSEDYLDNFLDVWRESIE